jgi:hypothetical protein
MPRASRRWQHDATPWASALSSSSAYTKTTATTAEIAQVSIISANGSVHFATSSCGSARSSSSHQSTMEVEIQCTEGMRFDTGSVSSDFVMVVKGWKVELVKLVVLLSEKKISLREAIIAEDVGGEACVVH